MLHHRLLWIACCTLAVLLYVAGPFTLIFAETRKWYVDEHALLTYSAPYVQINASAVGDPVDWYSYGPIRVALVAPQRGDPIEATVIVYE
jgi:hypothetical protein